MRASIKYIQTDGEEEARPKSSKVVWIPYSDYFSSNWMEGSKSNVIADVISMGSLPESLLYICCMAPLIPSEDDEADVEADTLGG